MDNLLVTGGSGMVGYAMKKEAPNANFPIRDKMNLLNYKSVQEHFLNNNYNSVVHLAAKV